MAIVVRADDLIRDAPREWDDVLDEHTDDPASLGRLWCMVLLMAIRDHATSVHYHPWREDGGLAYVVAGVRHALAPPPAELAGPVLAVARSLFTEPTRSGSPALFRGSTGTGAACASIELDVYGEVFPWDAVVWSSGERSGVELFRAGLDVAQGRGLVSRQFAGEN